MFWDNSDIISIWMDSMTFLFLSDFYSTYLELSKKAKATKQRFDILSKQSLFLKTKKQTNLRKKWIS